MDKVEKLARHLIASYLPKKDEIIETVLDKLSVLYKEFVDAGKFYEPVHHYEYGRCYTNMVEAPGLGAPYKYVSDWLEEYTGEIGSHYLASSYENEMEDILADIVFQVEKEVYGLVIDEVYGELEEELVEYEMELREEIGSISIDELEKRIKSEGD